MKYIRTILLTLLLVVGMGTAVAQSAADKLYSEGLAQQNIMTIQAQNTAIAKFQNAKKVYSSDVKKKQCDAAIATSRQIIKKIGSGSGPVPPVPPTPSSPNISLTPATLKDVDPSGGTVTVSVKVKTKDKTWSAKPISNRDGSSFVTVKTKNDDLIIECKENPTTRKRTQQIEIQAGKNNRTVTITQNGKPTIFGAEKNLVKFKLKGGDTSVKIYSNSDDVIKDNNNQNWKVVSKPEWVTVVAEQKNVRGVVGAVSGFASGLFGGKGSISKDASVITSVMKISVLKTSEPRSGEVIISSEGQRLTIMVQQN